MRGNIIQWDGINGIVAASGQRYAFDILTWRGDAAPKADLPVNLLIKDGVLAEVTPLADSDIAMGKFSQFGGEGSKMAKGILDYVGMDVAVAYGAFALSALFLGMLLASSRYVAAEVSITMAGVLNGIQQQQQNVSNGGFGLLLVFLVVATIAVPYFWRDKLAPLVFCIPLLVTLYADYQVFHLISNVKQMMGSYGISTPVPFSAGMGVYGSTLIAAYLALRGVLKFKSAAH